MSRTVFLVALTVLCLTEIHGRYAKDPRFYDRFGKDQGFVVKAADESNGKEFMDLPSAALGYKQEIEDLPYNNGLWYSGSNAQDEYLNAVQGQLPTSRDGNNVVQTLMKRYLMSLGHGHDGVMDQRQRRGHKRGQLYLNHLARMNK